MGIAQQCNCFRIVLRTIPEMVQLGLGIRIRGDLLHSCYIHGAFVCSCGECGSSMIVHFSLGNFIFNCYASQDCDEFPGTVAPQQGMLSLPDDAPTGVMAAAEGIICVQW